METSSRHYTQQIINSIALIYTISIALHSNGKIETVTFTKVRNEAPIDR